MKIIKTTSELKDTLLGYYKTSGNEKSVLKIKLLGQVLMYLTKGLWPDYIEDIMWKYGRIEVKILSRQCFFREDEFRSIIQHPADSLGCIFYLNPETPEISFSIQPVELPADKDLDEWLEREYVLPEISIETKVIGISRYDFLQDVKEWIKGENKVLSWEG